MRRTSIGRSMVVAVAAATVVAPGVAASAAVPAGWRTVATISSPSFLLGLAAADPAHAWAVGWNLGTKVPVVRAWNGSSWTQVSLPSRVQSDLGTIPALDTAAASGPSNVWALTEMGRWLHYDGAAWTGGRIASPSPTIQSSLAIGPGSAWAFGGKPAGSGSSAFAPYASLFTPGHGWKRTPVPGKGMIVGASAVSSSDIWAVIGTGSLGLAAPGSGLVHWTAGHWQPVTGLPAQLRNASLGAILARGDSGVWVGGAVRNTRGGTTEAIGHWNGHAWTVHTLPAAASPAKFHVVSIVPDGGGTGGLWALGFSISQSGNQISSRLWHLTAGKWTGPVEPVLAQRAAALVTLAAAGHSVWGVGNAGVGGAKPDGLIALWGPTP